MKAAIIGKGKMGQLIASTAKDQGMEVLGLYDALSNDNPDVLEQADVILDFSHRDNLDWYLDYARAHHIPLVLGTTALSEKQIEAVGDAAKDMPLFFSANYSLGIAVLKKLAADAAAILKDWDIEITEKHHNQKADAPSGTALSLLAGIDPDHAREVAYGRGPESPKRGREIGMHAVRGGTLPGYHEVEFFGPDESISLSHNAQSRQIFVNGALEAARFLEGKPNGLYDMSAILEEKLG